ncbi:MAG: hypothetical protein WCA79_15785 [Anaerolineales bacterium]
MVQTRNGKQKRSAGNAQGTLARTARDNPGVAHQAERLPLL